MLFCTCRLACLLHTWDSYNFFFCRSVIIQTAKLYYSRPRGFSAILLHPVVLLLVLPAQLKEYYSLFIPCSYLFSEFVRLTIFATYSFKAVTHEPYIRAVYTGRIYGPYIRVRFWHPYIRPVHTGRIYGRCVPSTRTYGPYIRPVQKKHFLQCFLTVRPEYTGGAYWAAVYTGRTKV